CPGPGTGTGAGGAPAVAITKVIVTFKPSVPTAEITVDGKDVVDNRYELEVETGKKKTIKIVAKATGYRTYEKSLAVGADIEHVIKMARRSSGGGGGGGGGGGNGPGDKIDL
ncbi:MAG TPA: hypothetical protein VM734_11500, partial [Kofleriaceae bacterium]|nr:hypothetical protein [Kofleriaceae bacterium]